MDYHLQEPYKAQHKETDLRMSLAHPCPQMLTNPIYMYEVYFMVYIYWKNENVIRE